MRKIYVEQKVEKRQKKIKKSQTLSIIKLLHLCHSLTDKHTEKIFMKS